MAVRLWKKVFVGFVALIALIVWVYSMLGGLEWREKVTLTVTTPTGVKSAYSVHRVGLPRADLVTGRSLKYRRGEAIVLELPDSSGPRYLFALLDVRWRALHIYKDDLEKSSDISGLTKSAPRVMPREYYPILVTFDDITKPETVKPVDPNNLAATFGEGYALKSVTLEITNERVTEGRVEEVLGWWPSFRGGPYNSMKSLKLPNDSPRGWKHLSPLSFWSLDRVKKFNETSK
ncbi:hypothetical protein ACFQ14_05840 [Pseudahrensia aquimaris]|uniref:DUF4384 domain-containing protein n=1 Tax=Pseudahrensia aquimaris TaxID=744461 RepID=A0ABW3FEC5_9HYPH